MDTAQCCKRVIGISLGSSVRDAKAVLRLGGIEIFLERRGTDGSLSKTRKLLEQWDGKADAIGLGGTDLYVYAGGRRYTFWQTARLAANVKHTPVLDGSGLKNTLERRLIKKFAENGTIPIRGSRVLLTCGVDRFGMAEALQAAGAKITFGDLVFGLNINKPLYSLKALSTWAALLVPVITKLPVGWFYPIGSAQEKRKLRHPEYFLENDIIAGDFHFIKKFMPDELPGKIIITNTVTAGDREMLRQAGVKILVTTTPCLEGRSFGTNIMEAVLVASKGADQALTAAEYIELLDYYKIDPSVEWL
ncbi:MAG: quinate 5-dehydrogenase [Phascolarctobacterium sp.]|nr:quinate 5-dehydrogenase [Phascolarctobacterium sp.]